MSSLHSTIQVKFIDDNNPNGGLTHPTKVYPVNQTIGDAARSQRINIQGASFKCNSCPYEPSHTFADILRNDDEDEDYLTIRVFPRYNGGNNQSN